ncbi:hypothetical protein ACIP4S_14765 [Streptomyces chartreusis]|uniref:hypothetical protein n=1 Tax=Streptomyces chartreusis TaxID=1969 RepID=UPI0037F6907F
MHTAAYAGGADHAGLVVLDLGDQLALALATRPEGGRLRASVPLNFPVWRGS